MNWKDWLQNFDENLIIHIHDIGTSEYLDPFMLLLRNALTWVPLYLFVLICLIKHRRNKALLFLIGITGFLISRLFIWWNGSGINFRRHPQPDALS